MNIPAWESKNGYWSNNVVVIKDTNMRWLQVHMQRREGSPSSTVCIASSPLGMDFGVLLQRGTSRELYLGMPYYVGVWVETVGSPTHVIIPLLIFISFWTYLPERAKMGTDLYNVVVMKDMNMRWVQVHTQQHRVGSPSTTVCITSSLLGIDMGALL